MMILSLFSKYMVAVAIIAMTLLGGFFPIFAPVNRSTKRILFYGESFAGGIFLGVGFIHLLPDAQANFQLISHYSYPLIFLICTVTIVLLRFLEEGAVKTLESFFHTRDTFFTFLLTILLSVHSLIEGAALGMETTIAGFLVIFIAIFSHKIAESFALGVSMRKSILSKKSMVRLMLLFSCMTPIGIVFGAFLSQFLHGDVGRASTAIFDSIAAGTFIYIATSHAIGCSCDHELDETSLFIKLSSFSLGLALMAVIAIWL